MTYGTFHYDTVEVENGLYCRFLSCNLHIYVLAYEQWRSQPDIWSCKCKSFCVYRPYKESISKEMNNDGLKLHSGCLPFTSQTHLVSNCANGTQKFRLENPVRSTRFPFPIRSDKNGNISENPEKCEWNAINRLKSPNRFKRTTFSSKPVVLVIFRLDRPKICVPFIFYPELPESL